MEKAIALEPTRLAFHLRRKRLLAGDPNLPRPIHIKTGSRPMPLLFGVDGDD